MKIKKKAAIAAAMFAAVMNFSACAYGPPPEGDYDPADNRNADVYGPPQVEWEDETIEESEENFDPGCNYNECVYGPPDEEWEDEMPEESGGNENSDMTADANENSEVNADE